MQFYVDYVFWTETKKTISQKYNHNYIYLDAWMHLEKNCCNLLVTKPSDDVNIKCNFTLIMYFGQKQKDNQINVAL